MKKLFLKTQKGFTLIETLVSVAIFASAITGLIAITAGGISNTNFVKNKFTASYLALEGAEMVHNIRDTSSISDVDWNSMLNAGGIISVCANGNSCRIDAWEVPLAPVACISPDDCDFMNYDQETGRFSYEPLDGQDNLQSIFKRTISIEDISPSEIRVTSRVDWNQGVKPHSVSYSYNLLDWTNSN